MSIDRLHSPVPRVHDVAIANLNQLYPLVLAPTFGLGVVPFIVGGAWLIRPIYLSGQIGQIADAPTAENE